MGSDPIFLGRKWGLTLIVFGMLLAACGQKAEGDGVTVTLGHAGPLTGSIAHQGKDDENGVALAIEQANARGMKIGGKAVTFRMLS